MDSPRCIDLSDLLAQVREALEDSLPERVWVRAELAAVQARSNGHCYLELCDQGGGGDVVAKARAVIWKSRFTALSRYFREATGSDFAVGMQVLLRVQVNFSELYGLTLVVDEVEPGFTIGAAEQQRRETLERLQREGLLDRQQALSLPALPYHLAVISAADAAGYGDFCRHLSGNEYGFVFQPDLFEATMQGASAPASIIDALARVESAERAYDAVLILRGGGSNLDLACFDDYDLAFTIANCPIPVLTAIGHDRDRHVADEVAFESVKTPTALSDRIIACFAAEDERISAFGTRLRMAFSARIAQMESRITLLESRIRSADPRQVLARGYSLVTDGDGVVLKSGSSLRPGDGLRVVFADGSWEVTVTGKVRNPNTVEDGSI